VVCLAPRAPRDSVRPRRLSGVVVRPLNFTVRLHSMTRHRYVMHCGPHDSRPRQLALRR
jgi:hypothetical protein